MPTKSPYLSIETDNEFTYVLFNGERIPFLDRDLTLLPIRNVTVEELAHHLLERLTQDAAIAALDYRAFAVADARRGRVNWLKDKGRRQFGSEC